MQEYGMAMAQNLSAVPDDGPFAEAYRRARTGEPAPRIFPMGAAETAEAAGLIGRISKQGKKWRDEGPDLSVAGPEPSPKVQIRPIY
jgi:hypothetical protein